MPCPRRPPLGYRARHNKKGGNKAREKKITARARAAGVERADPCPPFCPTFTTNGVYCILYLLGDCRRLFRRVPHYPSPSPCVQQSGRYCTFFGIIIGAFFGIIIGAFFGIIIGGFFGIIIGSFFGIIIGSWVAFTERRSPGRAAPAPSSGGVPRWGRTVSDENDPLEGSAADAGSFIPTRSPLAAEGGSFRSIDSFPPLASMQLGPFVLMLPVPSAAGVMT